MEQLKNHEYTFVIYESPFRLLKTLLNLKDTLGKDRMACVSREISKIHEEHKRGTLGELYAYFSNKNIKGEIVISVAGNKAKDDKDISDIEDDIDNDDNIED